MAVLEHKYCPECGKPDATFITSSGKPFDRACVSCTSKQADIEKVTYLAKQGVKPLEQRIAEIEEWIYDHRNIGALDIYHTRF